MMPKQTLNDELEQAVDLVAVDGQRAHWNQQAAFTAPDAAMAGAECAVELGILGKARLDQGRKILSRIGMPATEWQHRGQIMLELAFFMVAGLASRNLRKIPAPHVDEKLAREDMIAGRRRRRRITIHAGLAFESLAHEPLYDRWRGFGV